MVDSPTFPDTRRGQLDLFQNMNDQNNLSIIFCFVLNYKVLEIPYGFVHFIMEQKVAYMIIMHVLSRKGSQDIYIYILKFHYHCKLLLIRHYDDNACLYVLR